MTDAELVAKLGLLGFAMSIVLMLGGMIVLMLFGRQIDRRPNPPLTGKVEE